jgi:hypothetical protein
MPQILRTTLIPDEAQAADGVVNFDLPTNPISAVLLTVKALNDTTDTDSTTYSFISQLLAMVTNLNIRYRGATIMDGSLTDLAVLFAVLSRWAPFQSNANRINDRSRAVTIPLLFGRRPYDPMECFPATRRGDLVMQITNDVAVTGANGLILQAETIELLDAVPEKFLKCTTTQPAAFALGQNFVDLPIGNKILGVLLQAFNFPDTTEFNSSFGQVALQVDNVEVAYSESNWETLHGEINRRLQDTSQLFPHFHAVTDAALTPDAVDTSSQMDNARVINAYAYMDFDPLGDEQYAIDTKGAADIRLKVTSDTADATASRIMPVELVNVAPTGA